MPCDAQTLLNTAIANGYDKLSDRDLKEATVAAACAGGGTGGTGGVFQGAGNPNGVQAGNIGSIYSQISGGVLIAQWTNVDGGTTWSV